MSIKVWYLHNKLLQLLIMVIINIYYRYHFFGLLIFVCLYVLENVVNIFQLYAVVIICTYIAHVLVLIMSLVYWNSREQTNVQSQLYLHLVLNVLVIYENHNKTAVQDGQLISFIDTDLPSTPNIVTSNNGIRWITNSMGGLLFLPD